MIKNSQTAKKISDLMLEYLAKLDKSVAIVKSECGEEEFTAYRNAIAKVMGNMIVHVMNPLYKEHPEMKPKELKD